MRGRIPDSRAGRAGFRDAFTPDDPPVRAAAAAANATIDRGRWSSAEAYGLLVAVGMMNAHRAVWGRARAVPPRIVNLEARVGHVLQFDEGKIDVRLDGAKESAALVLRERTAAKLAARGRLIVPIDDHAGGIARTEAAVIGC